MAEMRPQTYQPTYAEHAEERPSGIPGLMRGLLSVAYAYAAGLGIYIALTAGQSLTPRHTSGMVLMLAGIAGLAWIYRTGDAR